MRRLQDHSDPEYWSKPAKTPVSSQRRSCKLPTEDFVPPCWASFSSGRQPSCSPSSRHNAPFALQAFNIQQWIRTNRGWRNIQKKRSKIKREHNLKKGTKETKLIGENIQVPIQVPTLALKTTDEVSSAEALIILFFLRNSLCTRKEQEQNIFVSYKIFWGCFNKLFFVFVCIFRSASSNSFFLFNHLKNFLFFSFLHWFIQHIRGFCARTKRTPLLYLFNEDRRGLRLFAPGGCGHLYLVASYGTTVQRNYEAVTTCGKMLVVAAVLKLSVLGRAPLHSWDTLSSMSFFHACNESGLWSERALDTITKFPFVTVEKGQAFNAPCPEGSTAPCAEPKIVSQLKAIKERNSSIATVFYMNSVLSWYFYHMVRFFSCHYIINQPSDSTK